jgi:hypothetical protein
MPDATRRWLDGYLSRGGKAIAVGRRPDGEWRSLDVVSEAELQARLGAMLPADVAFEPRTPEIGFIHHRLRDGDVYFVANTSNVTRTVRARFAAATANTASWNPLTGAVEPIDASASGATLTLEPYGSRAIVFRKEGSASAHVAARTVVEQMPLASGWTVSVGDGARTGSIVLPHSWSDTPATRFFSGAVRYERELTLPSSARTSGAHIVIDFGDAVPVEREALPGGTMRGNSFAALIASPIREAAVVFVNGRRAGSVWAPPYRIDLTDLARDGANTIAIEVYNTAINQLAEGGRLPDVNALVERYGQRFRLQDLDNLQPIPSGILAVPRLIVER